MVETKGKIFVLMPTYCNRQFLEAAVEGVMAQVVDLPVLLIIRDDASTDGTGELAEKLSRRFPGRIELILNEANQFSTSSGAIPEMLREILLKGGRFAAKSWLGRLRTKYNSFIALCEGDDYWTDPQKLQKQLEVFRANKSVRLVHHHVDIVIEPRGSETYAEWFQDYLNNYDSDRPQDGESYFRDGHNVVTCSAMLRLSAVYREFLAARPPGLLGDWILFALATRHFKPHFIHEKMSTYRIHENSFWSSREKAKRERLAIETYDFLHPLLKGRSIRRMVRKALLLVVSSMNNRK